MITLTESTRKELLATSKRSDSENDGKTRLEKTFRQKQSNSTKEFNDMDMNRLFSNGEMSIQIPVIGETDNYLVTVEFGSILDNIHNLLSGDPEELLTHEMIVKALMKAFNEEDLKVRCTCDDFQYREAYWNDRNDSLSPPPESEFPDETNPDNSTGLTCKHINSVLTSTSWLIKCAMVIYNYINYMEKNYSDLYEGVIFPAIYGKAYEAQVSEEPVPEEESTEPEFDVEKEYGPDRNEFNTETEEEQAFDIDKKDETEKRFDFDSEISDY